MCLWYDLSFWDICGPRNLDLKYTAFSFVQSPVSFKLPISAQKSRNTWSCKILHFCVLHCFAIVDTLLQDPCTCWRAGFNMFGQGSAKERFPKMLQYLWSTTTTTTATGEVKLLSSQPIFFINFLAYALSSWSIPYQDHSSVQLLQGLKLFMHSCQHHHHHRPNLHRHHHHHHHHNRLNIIIIIINIIIIIIIIIIWSYARLLLYPDWQLIILMLTNVCLLKFLQVQKQLNFEKRFCSKNWRQEGGEDGKRLRSGGWERSSVLTTSPSYWVEQCTAVET